MSDEPEAFDEEDEVDMGSFSMSRSQPPELELIRSPIFPKIPPTKTSLLSRLAFLFQTAPRKNAPLMGSQPAKPQHPPQVKGDLLRVRRNGVP